MSDASRGASDTMRRCLMRRLPRLIMPTHCFYTDNFSPTFLHSFI
ncbi:hypothetical protein HMPREF9349_00605 [Escherichia coli MS 79-10]|nr:hypothetical protein HMPREF9346_00222 [Escherichia coli MS 119-7]EFK51168.1 hypothetical protein HMPREF9345_02186 [Escherichia coli MS 107-1]EFO58854.1 hypothetical protein HMPREF9348_02137 [Escherichia coli MS 145-7]EGU99251.1 hypothetical protein HMPREF9349_00605 [Escherichia coli MS 79-10]ESD76052.1 hypothetical protein HMPREF1609_01669 [Escherichia coli 908541]